MSRAILKTMLRWSLRDYFNIFDSAQSNVLGLETNEFGNVFEFSGQCFSQQRALQKNYFPLRTSPANMTKSAGNCGFGHIYWRNP